MISINSKRFIFPIVAVTIVGAAAAFGARNVSAQSNSAPFSGLVQAIAQKFNLDQNQVQADFDDYRTAQTKIRLDQLVKAGRLTSTQEQSILDGLAKHPSRADLKAWIKSQGLQWPLIHGFARYHRLPRVTPTPTP